MSLVVIRRTKMVTLGPEFQNLAPEHFQSTETTRAPVLVCAIKQAPKHQSTKAPKHQSTKAPKHQSTKHLSPSTKHQTPSTKHQAPTTKHQAPSTKHQPPNTNHQAPSTKRQTPSQEEGPYQDEASKEAKHQRSSKSTGRRSNEARTQDCQRRRRSRARRCL